jgi:hypothetical protein
MQLDEELLNWMNLSTTMYLPIVFGVFGVVITKYNKK